MTVKQKIIERVNAIEDEAILNNIYNLIGSQKGLENAYQFTISELAQVNEAIADSDNGKYYTQEESEIMVAEWLKEKSAGI